MNKNILNQILKDFSLSNYENLFKGDNKNGRSIWYLIDSTKKRKKMLCFRQ